MKLPSLLSWWRRPASRHCWRSEETALPALDAEAEALPRAPGWFDSSHDLRHGLSVREHATPDTLASELPLRSWLEWQLAGCRAGAPAPPWA